MCVAVHYSHFQPSGFYSSVNEIETIHAAMLRYPETGVSEPFGPDVLGYKAAGKMFL
jgi:hypothetical protein